MSKAGEETHFREQHFHNAGTGDGSNNLCDDDHGSARICQAADECQSQSYSWIEQSAANTEEHPRTDCETEPERQ